MISVATAPDWLIERAMGKSSVQKVSQRLPDCGDMTFKGMLTKMSQTPEGERNETLNRFAFRVGKNVANGKLPESKLDQLKEAALESGLPADEVDKTIQSGFTAGLKAGRIPSGFSLIDDGLFYTYSNDKDKSPVYIGKPIHVTALIRDESSSEWGRLLTWADLDGKTHTQIILNSQLMDRFTSSWLSPLVSEGYEIAPGGVIYRGEDCG